VVSVGAAVAVDPGRIPSAASTVAVAANLDSNPTPTPCLLNGGGRAPERSPHGPGE
jgi:hypothetical protein